VLEKKDCEQNVVSSGLLTGGKEGHASLAKAGDFFITTWKCVDNFPTLWITSIDSRLHT
jgi:hypothetical protein